MLFKRTKKLPDGTKREYPHWWYRFKRNGLQIRVNTKQANRRTAQEMEAAHRTRLAKGEEGLRDHRDIPTLKAFAPRFTEAIEARSADKPRTAKFYREKLANLLAFPPLANARLDRIDEAMIERFVQHRRRQFRRGTKKGQPKTVISPATVNRALATLRRALRLAQEWRVIDRVPRIRMLPGERNREFVLTKKQETVYLEACPQPLRDLALLILDTGLRVGEAINLEWTDVRLSPVGDAKFGHLRVRQGKSKNAKRVVSLTERVTRMLEERSKTQESQFVFSTETGGRYLDSYLARLQQGVREKLVWSDEFVIHSLRHTMLTRLGEAGVDAFTIMRIAGHSSITISQKYVHPSPESLERAIEKLEAFNTAAERKGSTQGAHAPEIASGDTPQVLDRVA